MKKKLVTTAKLTSEEKKTLLRSNGLKVTPARLEVLAVLEKAREPMTIDDICGWLKDQTINAATVYRTVKSLNDEGVVKQIDFRHGHGHYELVADNDHHHIICVSCGKVEDFEGCFVEKIVQTVLKETKGFAQVTDHALELFGLCKVCAKKSIKK